MRICLLLLALSAIVASPIRGADATDTAPCALPCLQTAFHALAARGIAIDSNAACRAAALAVARTGDPRAEIRDLATPTPPPGWSVEKAEAWAEDLRYLKLRGLAADTATNVEERAGAWLREKCSGLILDLRDAAGDNLVAVDRLTAFFSGETGVLYVVRQSDGREESHVCAPSPGWHAAAPLLVLTDRDTRDGSELLAALLRGRSGVMLIGSPTRGDARAREVVPWHEHEGLWIATGRIALQRGPAYDPGGVTPDVQVEARGTAALHETLPDETATGRPLSVRARNDRALLLQMSGDATLRRAVEILLALKAVRMEMN